LIQNIVQPQDYFRILKALAVKISGNLGNPEAKSFVVKAELQQK
jgi:hypothetical protein